MIDAWFTRRFPGRFPEELDDADLPRMLKMIEMEALLQTAQAMSDPATLKDALVARPLLVEEIMRAQEKRNANR